MRAARQLYCRGAFEEEHEPTRRHDDDDAKVCARAVAVVVAAHRKLNMGAFVWFRGTAKPHFVR